MINDEREKITIKFLLPNNYNYMINDKKVKNDKKNHN